MAELKTIGIWIDKHISQDPPQPETCLVSIGKEHAIGSVYLIDSVRVVQSRIKRPYAIRYQLRVYRANDLKPEVHYNPHSNRVWVRDVEGQPIFWHPRGTVTKKK